MSNNGNYKKLKELMNRYNLTVKDVSEILLVSSSCVYTWLTKSYWRRNMPDQILELLNIKLLKKGIK